MKVMGSKDYEILNLEGEIVELKKKLSSYEYLVNKILTEYGSDAELKNYIKQHRKINNL